jgi:GNAT superfamily N-acetyltransferase
MSPHRLFQAGVSAHLPGLCDVALQIQDPAGDDDGLESLVVRGSVGDDVATEAALHSQAVRVHLWTAQGVVDHGRHRPLGIGAHDRPLHGASGSWLSWPSTHVTLIRSRSIMNSAAPPPPPHLDGARTTTIQRVAGRARLLDRRDLDEAAVVLARAFADEPGNRALFPDPELRRRFLELGGRMEIEAALAYASVYGMEVDGRIAGLAVWHPPHIKPRVLGAIVRSHRELLAQAPVLTRGTPHVLSMLPRHARAGIRLVRARKRAVKEASRGRTWYLAILATDPDVQGRGVARQLLDHVLDRCDADGLAAWLETTDPVNPPLYEHIGFRTVLHVEDAAWLPGFWVMRREPTPAG